MNAKQIFICFIISLFAVFLYFKNTPSTLLEDNKVEKCYNNLKKNSSVCSLECPVGQFSLPGMSSCHPWLSCSDNIIIIDTISISVVKSVYLAKWKNYKVVLSVLSSIKYDEDFKHNLFMIKSLTAHSQVVQLIGYCNNSIITKYYELGDALNINYHLKHSLQNYDTIGTRFNLCLSYVSVIEFLHTSPIGIRVMCDSSTLEKTLSQYLLKENLEIVINDLDATPQINTISRTGIICGNKMLSGTFIAPEQSWPYAPQDYDSKLMRPYDEKTDIWKIPDVCNWFLGNNSNADFVKYKLFPIHKECKNIEPSKRPNSSVVLEFYKNLLQLI